MADLTAQEKNLVNHIVETVRKVVREELDRPRPLFQKKAQTAEESKPNK